MGDEARVALLSFSTKGSAKHERVDKVRAALEEIKTREPNLLVDGELQLDAAVEPEVARLKAPGSPVAGNANVFVFPSLEAGNIGYKIAQRFGGWTALGPLLQGFAHGWHDLSRGCSSDDIYKISVVGLGMNRGGQHSNGTAHNTVTRYPIVPFRVTKLTTILKGVHNGRSWHDRNPWSGWSHRSR